MPVPGYSLVDYINSGSYFLLHSAKSQKNGDLVIIKSLKEANRNNDTINKLVLEHAFLEKLNHPNILKPISFINEDECTAIVFEYFPAKLLSERIHKNPLEVRDFLPLAVKLSETISYLHSKKIIHKDISPSHILISDDLFSFKLFGLHIATSMSRSSQRLISPAVLEGTLAYLSPEQTGRINRKIDCRTDLYSLGASFYEMLTGQPPFNEQDQLALVHCHIAKKVTAVNKVKPNIPKVLAGVITYLLKKNAEDRYQSAWGLTKDLELINNRFKEDSSLTNFELPSKNLKATEQFSIPQKLYGREKEINELMQSFARVATGSCEIFLVSGYSGVGKSALVREVYKPMTGEYGYFSSGKYDQYQRNIPYFAITDALNKFCRYILTEPNDELMIWQDIINEHLGENAIYLCNIISDLNLILNIKKRNIENKNIDKTILHNLFLNFITAICSRNRPFILFLDDMQWADLASLELIASLFSHSKLHHLLIIQAYRDNEVDEQHVFTKFITDIKKQNTTINHAFLNNLSKAVINKLISDTINIPEADCRSLSEIIFKKTLGNPFFVLQFITELYEKGLLYHDIEQDYWYWDKNTILAENITDNVVDFMAKKINELPNKACELLKYAASVSNTFDTNLLVALSDNQYTAKQIIENLIPAIDKELILTPQPISNVITSQAAFNENVQLKFLHDRVQQAAYSLIPDNERQQVHISIARLLYQYVLNNNILEESLFELANQFNKAIELLSNPLEIKQVIEINFLAAKKAFDSAAYNSAHGYLCYAKNLIGLEHFKINYSVTFEALLLLCKVNCILNKYTESDEFYELLLKYKHTPLDHARVLLIKMDDYHQQGLYQEALNTQYLALKVLNLTPPSELDDLDSQIANEISLIDTYLAHRSIDSLSDSTPLKDEKVLALLDTLTSLWITAYLLSDEDVVQWASVKMCRLCLEHGRCEQSAFAYILYGYVCVNRLNEFNKADEFGKVALKIADNYSNLALRGKVYFMYGLTICHWSNHLSLSTKSFRKSYQFSCQAGDWTYASYAAVNIISNLIIEGAPCDQIFSEADNYLSFLKEKNEESTKSFFIPGAYVPLLHFMGKCDNNNSFDCDIFNEQEHLICAEDSPITQAWYFYAKVRALYLMGQYCEALAVIDQINIIPIGVPGQIKTPEAYFYSCLVLLAKPEAYLDSIKYQGIFYHMYERLKVWSCSCEDNFLHKVKLIEAELASLHNQPFYEVFALYHQAIELAKTADYRLIEALANELFANYLISQNKLDYAALHQQRSHSVYNYLSINIKKENSLLTNDKTSVPPTNLPMEVSTGSIALQSMMQAANVLSEEMVINKLMDKLIAIVMEFSGASKVALLLKKNSKWWVENIGILNEPNYQFKSVPYTKSIDIPASVIRYVIRSESMALIGNVSVDSVFANDPYIKKHQPKSILCLPLIYKNRVNSIVYLENELTSDAFGQNHLDMLNLLIGQMAISIENSVLYSQMEEKVVDRTNDLEESLKQLKQTQNHLVESEKMASLGRLVAGVAHELNTPLGVSVTASSNLLELAEKLRTAFESQTLTRKDFVSCIDNINEAGTIVYRNLNRAAELVTNFKLVAVDTSNDEQREINLKEYLSDLVSSLSPALKKGRHNIQINCSENLVIKVDPGVIAHIFTNLILNSLIHGFENRQKGQITITAELQSSKLTVHYRDNGKGMSEEVQSKVFEPFYTTKRGAGGSGLGMNIVYNLVVQKLKGTISCQSKIGESTEFFITADF
ncbi:AAA family ATPase [Pseudoalteromonas sp. N1230-9]|uniref:AAA family ATPase n=1 Tax=Pseudoalteromonas sp. N1230-9 TaxID=2907156 RepID=UPI002B2A16FD|nr:AAA family ATPase [Pseudoalteromonas sp. N1230-9]